MATPKIQERIEQYEQSEIRFTLMAIVEKPLMVIQADLVENVQLLKETEGLLDMLMPEWRSQTSFSDHSAEVQSLMQKRTSLEKEQAMFQRDIQDAEEKLTDYETYAYRKLHEYEPFMNGLANSLASKKKVNPHLLRKR